MTGRIPLRSAVQLDALDSGEVIEGYFDGLDNEPEPGDNRSFSYWHGWRNGMADGKHMEHDQAMRDLARDVIQSDYLAKMRLEA